MAYEVVTVEPRTEMHARWSIFFDHLRVPWAYGPVSFRDYQCVLRAPRSGCPSSGSGSTRSRV